MHVVTGLIQVVDEICEVQDSDFQRTTHTALPEQEATAVVPIDDISPMLMDPPYPIYKFLAQQYKLHGTQPSAICRHNAMVCVDVVVGCCTMAWMGRCWDHLCVQAAAMAGCTERHHTWMVLSNLCSLPQQQPPTVTLFSPNAVATLELVGDGLDASVGPSLPCLGRL
jgi:hypothetical protein